jgi:hypothetical protein
MRGRRDFMRGVREPSASRPRRYYIRYARSRIYGCILVVFEPAA